MMNVPQYITVAITSVLTLLAVIDVNVILAMSCILMGKVAKVYS